MPAEDVNVEHNYPKERAKNAAQESTEMSNRNYTSRNFI